MERMLDAVESRVDRVLERHRQRHVRSRAQAAPLGFRQYFEVELRVDRAVVYLDEIRARGLQLIERSWHVAR